MRICQECLHESFSLPLRASQMSCSWDRQGPQYPEAEKQVRESRWQKGAQIISDSELFETPYFLPENLIASILQLATTIRLRTSGHCAFQALGQELQVVCRSAFSRLAGRAALQQAVVALSMPDGSEPGVWYFARAISRCPVITKIFYFQPGRHRFQGLAEPATPRFGVGICWDQWFP